MNVWNRWSEVFEKEYSNFTTTASSAFFSFAQAIKAKSVIQNKLFENKYKIEKTPEVRFDKFVKDYFLPYSKLHKKTYPDDVLVCNMLSRRSVV